MRHQTLVFHRTLSALILGLCLGWSFPCLADAETAISHLKPIDNSNPRSLLTGFIADMNQRYAFYFGDHGLITNYLNSDRLYLTIDEENRLSISKDGYRDEETRRLLDTSELPPAIAREQVWRLTLLLKEILDRIELPPIEEIPGATETASGNLKHWDLPGTDIRISRIDSGSREGDFVFNADTVRRLPELYERVKALPYKKGATTDWYDYMFHTPTGIGYWLRHLIPPRWFYLAPKSVKVIILDQPLWRWAGVLVMLVALAALFLLCLRIDRKSPGHWAKLLPPLSLVIGAPAALWVFSEVFRVSNTLHIVLTLSLWGGFYLALTWSVWRTGDAIAETLITSERLGSSSIDSQLIRLVGRLVSIVVSSVILVEGSNRLGLPSYSVLAGLGIGGVTFALAGQHTLANLLGSLIIMFEKPFRVGQTIRLGALEGEVEDVGFRSTRLRTPDNTVVNVPCSTLVNNNIENLTLRKFWRIRTVMPLRLDTPAALVESLSTGICELVNARSDVIHAKTLVAISEITPKGLKLLVDYTIKASSSQSELTKRTQIHLQCLKLAESLSVGFERSDD